MIDINSIEGIEEIIKTYLEKNLKVSISIEDPSSAYSNYGSEIYKEVKVSLLINEKEISSYEERLVMN